jgi:hypothetical protein
MKQMWYTAVILWFLQVVHKGTLKRFLCCVVCFSRAGKAVRPFRSKPLRAFALRGQFVTGQPDPRHFSGIALRIKWSAYIHRGTFLRTSGPPL